MAAIDPHVEGHAALSILPLVVYSRHRDEARRGALQIDDEIGVHLERDAVRVDDAAKAQRERSRRRLSPLRTWASNLGLRQIETVNPYGMGRSLRPAQRLRLLNRGGAGSERDEHR